MAKSKPSVIFPWKKACTLRKEIRERELKQEDFAVDLFLIVNKPASGGPFYCDPDQFFAITYATENLRKFCSGALARLAGRADGVSLVNIAQTFGGGKTHALGTLELFLNKKSGRLSSKKSWREPTDGNDHPR
jgi:predicted AAA+ superfamily ATPase